MEHARTAAVVTPEQASEESGAPAISENVLAASVPLSPAPAVFEVFPTGARPWPAALGVFFNTHLENYRQ